MSMDELWRSSDPRLWDEALRRYWDQVSPRNLQLEKDLDELKIERVRCMSPGEWYDFLRDEYFRWKYTAPNRYASTTAHLRKSVERGGTGKLDEIRLCLLSHDPDDIAGMLEVAARIPGLGPAGASGLLSLLYPCHFATVDQFVVKALREVSDLPERARLTSMNAESLSLRDGVLLIEIMRRKAEENTRSLRRGWTPRMIDKVLWGWRLK